MGAKRTNRPGISTTDRGFPRARFRSRGGSFSSRARYYSGYTPPRGRGRAFRWADAEKPHFRHWENTTPACTAPHSKVYTEEKGQDKWGSTSSLEYSPLWPSVIVGVYTDLFSYFTTRRGCGSWLFDWRNNWLHQFHIFNRKTCMEIRMGFINQKLCDQYGCTMLSPTGENESVYDFLLSLLTATSLTVKLFN